MLKNGAIVALLFSTLQFTFLKVGANYTESLGACRGGLKPGDDELAGRTRYSWFSKTDCEAKCSDDPGCFGFAISSNQLRTCWTYTSPFATGDPNASYYATCFTKNIARYRVTDGRCRGGATPPDNAGRSFHTSGDCMADCNADPSCTAFTWRTVDSIVVCWRYTSYGAEGDGTKDLKCASKVPIGAKYAKSVGPCRGGLQPGENNVAGRTTHTRSTTDCEAKCSDDPGCFGFAFSSAHPDTCWTYTSPFVTGDPGVSDLATCFSKTIAKYQVTDGRCRGGATPANNAGLTFQSNRDCMADCDADPECAAFAWKTAESTSSSKHGCWRYTSFGAKGDGTINTKCASKVSM